MEKRLLFPVKTNFLFSLLCRKTRGSTRGSFVFFLCGGGVSLSFLRFPRCAVWQMLHLSSEATPTNRLRLGQSERTSTSSSSAHPPKWSFVAHTQQHIQYTSRLSRRLLRQRQSRRLPSAFGHAFGIGFDVGLIREEEGRRKKRRKIKDGLGTGQVYNQQRINIANSIHTLT